MFKRANKITALLVAAASVMSVVPAMAAERLGTKDGTLNYGIAFDGGKYIYDGYRTDDDNTGIYFNSGDKDKLVEDLEDYEIVSKYGSKYAFAEDNGDQYLVDLSTGKVADNETDEEKRDTIQGTLRSTLKKTDRYENTSSFDDVTVGDRLFTHNDQFGEVWYAYEAKGDGTVSTTQGAVTPSVTLAVPTKASQILALAEDGKSVKVFGTSVRPTTTTGSSVVADFESDVQNAIDAKIADEGVAVTCTYAAGKATIDTIDGHAVTGKLTAAQLQKVRTAFTTGTGDAKATISAGSDIVSAGTSTYYTGFVNENGKYIDASDLANVYAYSTEAGKVVKIEEYNDYDKDNQIMANLVNLDAIAQDKDYIYAIATVEIREGATEAAAKASTPVRTAYFYQKIAKAQGDKKDEAYIPKTVDSYEIDNKAFYDDGDASDAYKAILTDDDGYAKEDNLYTVKDGTLYVVRVKSDKVKVFKMKTKKAKVDAIAATGITTKLDAPLLQKDADGDHDIFDGAGTSAVSLDVDGNVWALDKGSIYKVDGTTFKETYTLDRSIDHLDVYNDKNLIAWEGNNGDGNVYTTVSEGEAVTHEEAPAPTPAKVGWDKLADGTWNFYDATGAKVANNWVNVGGAWYFLKADGVMATGWQQVGTTWYYLTGSGAMATGWVNDNGTWYYLNASGAMLANTTVDGYVLGASGAWIK